MGYKKNKKKKKQDEVEELTIEDVYPGYYFIAGFTGWGFPYGITMEEAEEQGLLEEDNLVSSSSIDDDMPF